MDAVAEVEQYLIGSILLNPDQLIDVIDIVTAEDFKDSRAQKAFMVCLDLWKQKKVVDLSIVGSTLVEDVAYLASCHGKGAALGGPDYARQVALHAKERRVNSVLTGVLRSAHPITFKLETILDLYQREMFNAKKTSDIQAVMTRFCAKQEENKKMKGLGLSTGFRFLDEQMIQYVPGHIWVMGAYTSVGKTAMMVQKICNLIVGESDPAAIVISTEMTEEQIVARILGNLGGIHPMRIMTGNYANGEERRVEQCKELLVSKNLKIFDDIYTLEGIEMIFRKADLQGGVDIGFIDYVQNCQVTGAMSEYQSGSILAKKLQQLAKDTRCALICLSQVSNDVGRGNTGQLEFKGAGEWAAVADVGVFLERNSLEGQQHKLRYHVKKNRHGVLLAHEFEYTDNYTRLKPAFR